MSCVILGAATAGGLQSVAQSAAQGAGAPPLSFGKSEDAPSAWDAPKRVAPAASGESALPPLRITTKAAAPTAPTGPAAPWSPPKPQPKAGAPVDDKPAEAAIDLGPLRYYAAQGDLARVSAEIRSLRNQHPEWQPPDDLFDASAGSIDEQPIWDLFAKGDIAGAREAIAAVQRDRPDWQPSADLRAKLSDADTRGAITAAAAAGQWQTVLDTAADNGRLLTCANLDILWSTLEALVRTGEEARALDGYGYVLTNCRNLGERLATVQKASLLLKGPGAVEGLVARGHPGPDGRSEFEPVLLDLARRRVGEASAPGSPPPPAKDVADLAADFERTHNAADAEVLGWSAHGNKSFQVAEGWFRKALSVADTPKANEGLALALREQGKLAEAQKVAFSHAAADPANRKVFVEIVTATLADPKNPKPDADTMAAYTKAVNDGHVSDAAQGYGWYLYRTGDTAGATSWFKLSNDWQANEGAIVGLMVSTRKAHQTAAYADLVKRYSATYPKVAELAAVMKPHYGAPAPAQRTASRDYGVRRMAAAPRSGRRTVAAGGDGGWGRDADDIVSTFQSGNYAATLAKLDARRQTRREVNGLAIVRGWAQLHSGDVEGAQRTFDALKGTELSREGQDGLREVDRTFHPRLYR